MLTKELIPAFEEANPGVTVEYVDIPYDSMKQKLTTGAAGGEFPDLVRSDSAGWPSSPTPVQNLGGFTWPKRQGRVPATAPRDARSVDRAEKGTSALLWRVRTTMADRPGALAALADRCGEHGVNILGLQIFPHLGRVTDELLLAVPGDWRADQVKALVAASGGDLVAVSRCSERSLVDAPTKYLRVALQLLDEPSALAEALAELLDVNAWADGGAQGDALRVEAAGSTAEVRRVVPFTEVERARAAALAQFPRWALTRATGGADVPDDPGPARPSGGGWSVRPGRLSDTAAVRRMHQRCSTETLFRRYHSPTHGLPRALEPRLLQPGGGASFVATVGNEVVGMVVVAPYDNEAMEVGVLVEDGWQRQGIGSNLLHAAAVHARELQQTSMLAIMQPDNRALLPTLRRCGLNCRVRTVDGTAHVTIPLVRSTAGAEHSDPASRRSRPAARQLTAVSASSHEQRGVQPLPRSGGETTS